MGKIILNVAKTIDSPIGNLFLKIRNNGKINLYGRNIIREDQHSMDLNMSGTETILDRFNIPKNYLLPLIKL